MSPKSILIIGATGLMGRRFLQAAAQHPTSPDVYVFVRNPDKIEESDRKLCKSIIQGDATSSADIQRALEESQPDYLVTTVGLSKNLGKQDIREQNAKAILAVTGPACKFDKVKVIVISSLGAGDSTIKMGIEGSVLGFMIRNVLIDHTNQEQVFRFGMNNEFKDRVMFVRPTNLTDGKNSGKIHLFQGHQRPPTTKVDRIDVAEYVVNDICDGSKNFGKAIHITAASEC